MGGEGKKGERDRRFEMHIYLRAFSSFQTLRVLGSQECSSRPWVWYLLGYVLDIFLCDGLHQMLCLIGCQHNPYDKRFAHPCKHKRNISISAKQLRMAFLRTRGMNNSRVGPPRPAFPFSRGARHRGEAPARASVAPLRRLPPLGVPDARGDPQTRPPTPCEQTSE